MSENRRKGFGHGILIHSKAFTTQHFMPITQFNLLRPTIACCLCVQNCCKLHFTWTRKAKLCARLHHNIDLCLVPGIKWDPTDKTRTKSDDMRLSDAHSKFHHSTNQAAWLYRKLHALFVFTRNALELEQKITTPSGERNYFRTV